MLKGCLVYVICNSIRGRLVCVICNSNSIHSLILKFCLMIVCILKMCTFYFCARFIIFFIFLTGFELRHFFSSVLLRWCLVCVNCDSNGIRFFYIQTLHNDFSHIENVHLPFCAHLINIFPFLTGVELPHVFPPRC